MHSPQIIHWYGPWYRVFARGLPRKWRRFLQHWLSRQRWFLSKGTPRPVISLVHAISFQIEQRTIWWLFLQSQTEPQGSTFQLPLVLLDEPVDAQPIARLKGEHDSYVCDAWQWPPFAHAMLSAMSQNSFEVHSEIRAWSNTLLDVSATAKPVLMEQSNSTIVFEKKYFMKALRQVVAGIQPETEMCLELANRHFPYSIPIRGGLELVSTEQPACLAVLSPRVEHQANGWIWFSERIGKLKIQWNASGVQLLIDASKLLGRRTRQLHQCLELPTDHPEFQPVRFVETDYRMLLARINSRYQIVIRKLARCKGRITACSTQVSQLLDAFPRWKGRAVPCLAIVRSMSHRIHGDYHLGQVLRTESDWLITDFEGEPLRSLAERRAMDLPWRDVAGMLRSFSYLAASLMPDVAQDQKAWMTLFHDLRRAFLEGYLQQGSSSLDATTGYLLQLYELEKALYEIEYELVSRPDWLHIPVGHAVELLSDLLKSDAGVGASNVSAGESDAGH